MTMKKELIKKSLETGELQLTFKQKEGHYGMAIYLLIIPAVFLFFYIKDTNIGNINHRIPELPITVAIVCGLSILLYRFQRKKLKFVTVATDLDRAELMKIIELAGLELKWSPHFSDDQVIIAQTFPGFLSGSWGEQITIMFDNQKIHINSICNPDNRGSIFSYGRNQKNINLLVERVKAGSH
jgi:hypothetical protein